MLYQLYRKVTPQGVSQLEAPTYREWRALHGGEWKRQACRARVGQARLRGRSRGGCRLGQGGAEHRGAPRHAQLHGASGRPAAGELADFGLSLLKGSEAPAWSSLRHYDSHMIDALRGRGFSMLLTQLLLVKELAVRVPVSRERDWCRRSDDRPTDQARRQHCRSCAERPLGRGDRASRPRAPHRPRPRPARAHRPGRAAGDRARPGP